MNDDAVSGDAPRGGRFRPAPRLGPDRILRSPLPSVIRQYPEVLAPLRRGGVDAGSASGSCVAERGDADRVVEIVLGATGWRPPPPDPAARS